MNSDNSDDTTDTGETDDQSPFDKRESRMETTTGTERQTEPQRLFEGEPGMESLAENRTIVMVAGVVLALLGIVAILSPLVSGFALTLLLGGILVAGAIVHTAAAFSAKGWSGFAFGVLLALLYGVAGVGLLVNPTLGLVTLTLLLGVYFLVEGVIQLLMGLRIRANPNWGWMLFSGIVSLLLSSLILLEFPTSALWAVGLLFGVNLLTSGVAMASLAMAATPEETPSAAGAAG